MTAPNRISRPTQEEVDAERTAQEAEQDATEQTEAAAGSGPVRRQPQAQEAERSARQRRIEREDEQDSQDEQIRLARKAVREPGESAPEEIAEETSGGARSAVEIGDEVFAMTDTEPPVPNTQPPTQVSQMAVLKEAARRAEAVDQGARDAAVADRLFSEGNADLTPAERVKKLTGRQRQYAQLMALNCAKPLVQGIDGNSLTSMVTSAAIVWAVSPQFRALMSEYADPLKKVLREHRSGALEENSKVPLGSSPTKAAVAKAEAQRKDAQFLSAVKASMEGTETVPFSVETGAQALLQLHEDAYVAVRQGRDYDEVMAQMEETVTELDKVFVEQSLNPDEVRESARLLLGERAGTDHATLSQFTETANGRVRMTPHRAASAGGSASATWDASWRIDRGGLLKTEGLPMFTVRPVMTVDEHVAAMRKVVSDDLAAAVREGGFTEQGSQGAVLNTLAGHHLAWDLKDVNPGVPGAAGANPNAMLASVQRARLAYGAMVDDGLTPEVRHAIAGVGLEQGLEQFLEEHPEMASVVETFRSAEHQEELASSKQAWLDRLPEQPLAPIVSDPANPLEAQRLELLGVDPGQPEAARDLGTKPVQECVLGPWGPRPSQEHLENQLQAQLTAEQEQARARELRREEPEAPEAAAVATPVTGRGGPAPAKGQRRPVFARQPAGQAAAGEPAEPSSPWTIVTQAQNAERVAKGMGEVNRVPAGMPAVPVDEAGLEREQAERTRLETAPRWEVVTQAQNIERVAKGLPPADKVPAGLPKVPGDAAALQREVTERARLEALVAKTGSARRPDRVPAQAGSGAGSDDAAAAAATDGAQGADGADGSVTGDASTQGRRLKPGVAEAAPVAAGAKALAVGGEHAVAERRERQAEAAQVRADRQVWDDTEKVTQKSRQQQVLETQRRLRNERNRRKLDPEHQPEK